MMPGGDVQHHNAKNIKTNMPSLGIFDKWVIAAFPDADAVGYR
jgi:hypothetical protein